MKTTIKRHTGFTLIELMVTIAIIGILTSVAFPSFQTYAIKAETAVQIAGATRPIRLAVAEFAQRYRGMPTALELINEIGTNDAASSCFDLTASTVYGQTSRLTAIITTTFLTDGGTQHANCDSAVHTVPSPLSGRTVTLNGKINLTGVVNWLVDNSATNAIASKYAPKSK